MTLVVNIIEMDLTLGLGMLDLGLELVDVVEEIIIDTTEELNIVNELVDSSYETFVFNGFGNTPLEVPCSLLN